jgi:hypothetical protein
MGELKDSHIIISGIGRSGTTFLVKLFTELGMDTGFTAGNYPIFENCNAGLETPLNKANAPYVVKDPRLCDYLPEIMVMGKFIEHAFIPVRKLEHAVKSRVSVQQRSQHLLQTRKSIPGGLWDVSSVDEQQQVLAEKFYRLIYNLTLFEIPTTLLEFPRLACDATYLYNKLQPVLKVSFDEFNRVFYRVADPAAIHDFDNDAEAAQ